MISNILRQAEKREKYNILCTSVHERVQGLLSETGHNFYVWDHPHCKRWVDKYYPRPANFFFLPTNKDGVSEIPRWLDIDFVMIESVFGHYHLLMPIAQQLQVPTIRVEHTTTLGWPEERVRELRQMSCDINVFITDDNRRKWMFDESNSIVIDHGVDSDLFRPGEGERKNQILVVANDLVNRGYILGFDIIQRITEGLPVKFVGDTEGLSKPAESVYDLVRLYQESSILLNCTRMSPQPYNMLEGAATACCPVSTATCHIPHYFTHGENSILSNDEGELRRQLIFLLENPHEARRLGNNARELIKTRFSKERFLSQWNSVFKRASQTPYTGIFP